MDKSTAQAIHELATAGRLSDESIEAVADALDQIYDEASGRWISEGEEPDGKGNTRPIPDHVPQDKATDDTKATKAIDTRKGAAR